MAVLATVYVERLKAYGVSTRGGATAAEVATGWTKAFHQSIAVAAVLGVVAMAAAFFINDDDAAPTMKRPPKKAAETPA